MNISVVSYSSAGGAGKAAHNLARGLTDLGFSVDEIFASETTVREEPFRNPKLTMLTSLDNAVIRKSQWPSLFSLLRFQAREDLARELESSKILILRWSVGLFGLENLLLRDKKVIWTLPDEAWFTGGCHNSVGCLNFSKSCHECPAVRPPFRAAVSRGLESKAAFFDGIQDLTFVAHSENMLRKFSKSTLGLGRNIVLIPNPISPDFTSTRVRKSIGVDKVLKLLFVADNIDDPIKGFHEVAPLLIAAGEKRKISIIVVGKVKDKTIERYPGFLFTGTLSTLELAEIMDDSHVLIVSSAQEAAGNVIPEAGSRGVPSFIREGSGVEEFGFQKQFGLVYSSNEDLIKKIAELDSEQLSKLSFMAIAASRSHNYLRVAASYADLFELR